jgi:histo-blood group ABO system transferase
MRYHGLLEHHSLLSGYGQLLCLDVDMLVCSRIRAEEISSQGITAVIHPGFPTTFERRRESTAFVEGEPAYYCGGVVGGERGSFLHMAGIIAKGIDADRANGILAVWHDESHLNRYLYDHPPARVLTPAYCFTGQARYYGRWMGCLPRPVHPEDTAS